MNRHLSIAILSAMVLLLPSVAWATSSLPSFQVNGGNDPAVAQLGNVFGTLFSGGIGSSDNLILPIFAKLLNTCVLAVGALFFMYQLLTGIIQTAHDGEVLGKAWSSLWVPIRFTVAAALMVPLPSGYCGMQQLTALIVTEGVNMGGWAWTQVADKMLTGGAAISAKATPDYDDLAQGIWQMSVCRWKANLLVDGGQTNWPSEEAFGPASRTNSSSTVATWAPPYNGAKGVSDDGCGHVTYAASAEAQQVPALVQAHIAATDYLVTTLDPIAKRVVDQMRDGGATTATVTSSWVRTTLLQSEQILSNGVSSALSQAQSANTRSNDLMTAVKSGGWLQASTWWNYVTEQNRMYQGALWVHATYVPPADGKASLFDNDEVAQRIDRAAGDLWHHSFDQTADGQAVQEWALPLRTAYINNELRTNEKTEDSTFSKFLVRLNAEISKYLAKLQTALIGLWKSHTVSIVAPMSDLTDVGSAILGYSVGVPVILAAAAAAIGVTGFGGTALMSALSTPFGALLTTVMMALTACGLFLTIVLPMIPYITWMSGVLGYFILVVEAIIAGPLWCIAHLKAGGEGIHGQAGAGYMITFNLLMRPILMVGGLVAGMAVFVLSVSVINGTFAMALADTAANIISNDAAEGVGLVIMAFVMWIGKLAVYVFLIFIAAERSFALIHKLPDAVSRWVGGHAEQLGEEHSTSSVRAGILKVGGHAKGAASSGASRLRGSSGDEPTEEEKKAQEHRKHIAMGMGIAQGMAKYTAGGDNPQGTARPESSSENADDGASHQTAELPPDGGSSPERSK